MPYQLVAIDVDGTLENSAHELSSTNAAALQAGVEAGLHVVLATGKQYVAIKHHITALQLPGPHITAGGAIVTDGTTHEDIYRLSIPADLAVQVVEKADDLGITIIAFRDGQTFTREHNADIDYMLSYGDPHPSFLPDITQSFDPLPLQLMCIAYQNDELYERAFAEFEAIFGDVLGVRKSSPYYIEFTNQAVSKGTALTWLCERLNVPLSDTVTIGDSYNDFSMFEISGLSFAMGQSAGAIQAKADRVAPANDRDGVAVVIQELLQQS